MAWFGPLVDTGVLIDYFGGIENRECQILDRFLEEGPPPATAPIIVQEYLQGLVRPEEFALARSDLENFHQLSPPDYPLHLQAAEFHSQMRRRGVTIPSVDTLIVSMARATNCSLLTRDARQIDLAHFLRVPLV
ncbi:MAG: PIN domain-containing protein [Deltaproteobacteria bacterium]|nr:PIN domain-containing protein [Deltaproteobacteria bacterium]